MTQNKNPKSTAKKLGWAGLILCGLCCSLPIIGAAVGVASLTAISFYLEKISLLVLGIAAFLFLYAWYKKRKKARSYTTSCDTNCDCKAETTTKIK